MSFSINNTLFGNAFQFATLTGPLPVSVMDILIALVVSVAISLTIILVARRILRKTKLSDPIKHSIMLMAEGPLSASIIGFSIMQVVTSLSLTLPFLNSEDIVLAIEIGVLAISVRIFGIIAKNIMLHFTSHKEVDKTLIYGVYTLGIIGLAFILLTSPASPVVVSGVWSVVGFGTGLIIVYMATYIANTALVKYATILSEKEPQMAITITFARRLAIAAIALVGIAIVTFTSFPSAGATVASLFVAAGFASIVVGLAAQSSMSNILAGMIVSTSKPFCIGDAVLFQMPWGAEWCWVEDLRLSYTILKTWDKRRLVIPNQMFLSNAIVNYTMNDESKLCTVFMHIPYEADLDTVMEIMKDEARKHPSAVPTEGLPNVNIIEYDDSGVQLRLLLNAPNQGSNWQMARDLLYSIRKRLMEKGITIQYPRREIVFGNTPPEFFDNSSAKTGNKGKPYKPTSSK